MINVTFFNKPEFAGRDRSFDGIRVDYVGDSKGAEIVLKKYTADYSTYADKQFVVVATGRRYKTLEAAAKVVAASKVAA